MELKTSQSYDAVLHFVKVNLLPEFRPCIILTDFEIALREMLVKHLPSATAHGCWFHSNQVCNDTHFIYTLILILCKLQLKVILN